MTGVTLPASIRSLRATRSSWFVETRKLPDLLRAEPEQHRRAEQSPSLANQRFPNCRRSG